MWSNFMCPASQKGRISRDLKDKGFAVVWQGSRYMMLRKARNTQALVDLVDGISLRAALVVRCHQLTEATSRFPRQDPMEPILQLLQVHRPYDPELSYPLLFAQQ
jgi:hypothetical protein